MGLRRKSGTLLPSYTDDELEEATFGFDKFYVQSVHYDDLVKENETLRKNLDAEIAWRTRDDWWLILNTELTKRRRNDMHPES